MLTRTSICALLLTCLALPASFAHGDDAKPDKDAEKKTYEVKVEKDIAYYEGDDADKVKHKLDLFVPKDKKDFPVFFFIHGGAWVHGDKNTFGIYSSLATNLAKQGIGVVLTNYRLSPGVKHPEHIKDVARAFAWTYKNIEKYGGRPDQIFVSGHSAGGHLAALLAVDDAYLKTEGLSSAKIKGVIPVSGVYRFPDKFLPLVFGDDEEVRKKAAPIYHVKGDLPPFLILYADHDLPGCDKDQSEAFCKGLNDKGTKATTLEIKDSNHIAILLSLSSGKGPAPKAIVEFIMKQTEKEEKR
jgi:acetyl esterase/lipase